MKSLVIFLILFNSSFSFSYQDQKLPSGEWAYYGKEFYQILKSKRPFERRVFNQIFNETHSSSKGVHDEIATQCRGNCYRNSSVGYDMARKIMFGELDRKRDSKGSFVLDVYCGKKFYFSNLNEVSNMHTKVNIEHTWPQSKFNGNYPKDVQKSDMHHLYLTDSHANSVRGNSPFGFISDLENRMDSGCGYSKFGLVLEQEVYTPPAPHRGNVARSLFYFSMRYNLPISDSEEKILRSWHKQDPIDQAEIDRHEAIAQYQKVRNPFIDHPELVDRIGNF